MGSYVWHDGALGRVCVKGHAGATIAVFTAGAMPRRGTDRTNVAFTMSGSSTARYDLPPLLVGTASLGTSGRVHVRYHEVQVLRAVANHIISPADPRFVATCSAGPSTAGSPDIQHDPSRVDSDDAIVTHEMLPWGCHYRNLVSQAGHTWVAADLGSDPQVARVMDEAMALSAAEDRSQPTPALLAYSDGSVTANGALGSAAAMLRIGATTSLLSCGSPRRTRHFPLGAPSGRGCSSSCASPSMSEAISSCGSATCRWSTPLWTARGDSVGTGFAATTGISRRSRGALPTTGR